MFAIFTTAAALGIAQNATYSNRTGNPCPGGTGVTDLETVNVLSLDYLVRTSSLIVEGSVGKVLPSFGRDANNPASTETDSLISVSKVFSGAVPSGATTISLGQIGGTVGSCTQLVPNDPLAQEGDQYVLFLVPDMRKQVPNTSGAPRYTPVGIWSGRVPIVNGAIAFLKAASPSLHKYDGLDISQFETVLTQAISVRAPKK
jgi:hypothetical protein